MNAPKPATPLPWKSDSPMAIDRDRKRAITVYGTPIAGVANMIEYGGPHSKAYDDAAYIVHASNAYPELVAALRYLASKVEDGDDALGTQQGRVMAQDLLRKIGELQT